MGHREQLISALEDTYGPWEKMTSRFGTNSFGQIADQLCLSNSLFTKLISGTATEGMYIRCIKNVNRIKKDLELNEQVKDLESTANKTLASRKKDKRKWQIATVLLAMATLLAASLYFRYDQLATRMDNDFEHGEDFLQLYFDDKFGTAQISPYLTHPEVQDYCPCSGFEGKWELAKPYYIPLPFNRPGLYYYAKATDIRLKCAKTIDKSEVGNILWGFEKMTHELWIDNTHESLVPRYFNAETKQFTKEFYKIDFENDSKFERIAEISSFMFNRIVFDSSSIHREAEPCGRFAYNVNYDVARKYKVDIEDLLKDVVGNMGRTECQEAVNPNCNPNTLIEGKSTIEWHCNFPIYTENLGIGGAYPYSKGFRLIEQHYSDNLLCSCDS